MISYPYLVWLCEQCGPHPAFQGEALGAAHIHVYPVNVYNKTRETKLFSLSGPYQLIFLALAMELERLLETLRLLQVWYIKRKTRALLEVVLTRDVAIVHEKVPALEAINR